MRKRMKKVLQHFLLPTIILFLFFLLFSFLDYPLEVYFYALGFSILCSFVYGIFQYKEIIEDENKDREIEELEERLKQCEYDRILAEKEIEEYFILWIHQIKIPITASRLLLDSKTMEAEEKASYLKQEILKIENYTNMALNFTKVIHGEKEMEFAFVSIDKVMKGLLKKYRIFFIQERIPLEYSPIKVEVLSDGKWLSIMVEQFLSNAIKYSNGKKIKIYWEDGLVVEDYGMGIRTEELPKISHKGYSGYHGRYHEKSSGLGLYLVSLIQEKLHHQTEFTSKIGEGTKVKIHFQEWKLTNL